MRNRSRYNSEPVSIETYRIFRAYYSKVSIGFSETDVDHETMEDIVTPNFRKRLRAGELINNPCFYTHHTVFGRGGGSSSTYQTTVPTNGWDYFGALTEYFASIDSLVIPSLEAPPGVSLSEAKLRAIANIDPSTFDFAEDFAEIKETIEFLKSPFKSLRRYAKLIRNSRRKKVSRGMDVASAASAAWLEYRFAVTPLVRSCYDAVQAISAPLESFPKRRTSRGFCEGEYTGYDQLLTATSGRKYSASGLGSVKYSAQIHYEGANSQPSVARHLGVRLKDIPETVWAVVPFSFMVDRMIDISSTVRAYTNLQDPSIKILAASSVVRDHKLQSLSVSELPTSPIFTHELHNSDNPVTDYFHYNREAWEPSVDDLRPNFSVKGLVDDVTSIADLATIIIQLLR